MVHLPEIIQDLALILMAAAATTLLSRALKQPVVLGYIVAGFLVSSHFSWMPTVLDKESVNVWAEIGVIFLLFALGLEFSFKKLARVGAPATVMATSEIIGMSAVGYVLGRSFGWGPMDSIYLGGVLAVSSTTIIIRAFEELGMKTRGFAGLVFGILIVEDLFSILLIVILTTISVTQTVSGVEMGVAALKLAFFLTLWFVLGIFLIPTFLKRTRHLMHTETLLVVSIGLCFLMVVLASKVGFSPALGAFIMGSLLAETLEGEKIEHLIGSVKDLFAAVFFVSVGMLIDPNILVKYAFPILIITVVTIVGKLITIAIGGLLSGQSLRKSTQSGLSLAQIGEFSFIIASVGMSLKATSDFLYPIVISVSAVTTFTTPYMIKWSDPIVDMIEGKMPKSWRTALEFFHTSSSHVSQKKGWKNFLQNSGLKIFANGVVVTAIFLTISTYVVPLLKDQLNNASYVYLLGLALAFLFSSPFLWAMVFGRFDEEFTSDLWREGGLTRAPLIVFEAVRLLLAVMLTAFLSSRFVPALAVATTTFVVMAISFFVLSRYISGVYIWLEARFVTNLNEKEVLDNQRKLPTLAPWDSHLVKIQVSPNAPLVGKKLSEAMVRETYGITIALIERGSRIIAAPGRNERLYPGDILQIIGTDEQISRFKEQCQQEDSGIADLSQVAEYSLHSVMVEENAFFAHKSIRESGLREATQGLVVGIEKEGRRTLNPDSSVIIEPGDVLWIVGQREAINEL